MKSTRYLTVALSLAAEFFSVVARAEPAAGSPWTEPTTGMEFLWVPSGCFDMGSTDGNDNEKPVHHVCVTGFYLGKYEVTQAQYQQVMGNNPSQFLGPERPVERVGWSAAIDFALELSNRSKVSLRLPSDAEWEYACRAGGQHDTYCGERDLPGLAWYRENSGGETHPVGGRRANAWGLFDMSGNVWEWTQDCWHESYDEAPTDGSAWTAGGDCAYRVKRGGGWGSIARGVRATSRDAGVPGIGLNYRGVRLARTLPPR